MTNKIFNVLLLFVVISSSCKKDNTNTSTATIGSDFFIEGKGMRKVWGIQSNKSGLGEFGLEHLTVTPDGYIHTAFTYANANSNGAAADYTAYRKKINIATGDTAATNGIPASINKTYIGQQQSGCLVFGLVPYTDKLVYSTGQLINGNPNWQTMMFGDGFAKIYDTRQAACFGYSNVAGPSLGVGYFNNGIKNPTQSRYINPAALSASVEMPINGDPLAFIALKTDSLLVMDFNANIILASIPMDLFLQYLPPNSPYNYMPSSRIVTKRNFEGTKIIGTVFHSANYFPQGNGRMISTFVYDIASKALTLKVKNSFLNTGFYLTTTEDVDDNGNYYYQNYVANPTVDTKISINKITPAGNNLYKTGFLNQSSSLISLKVVSNKLIIACGVAGNSTFTGDRGKGSMVIAVEQ